MRDEYGVKLDDFEKNPSRAIRKYCLEQCSYTSLEVKLCACGKAYQGEKPCPLYPFRLGSNPFNKKNLTEEQREKISQRLKNIRLARE